MRKAVQEYLDLSEDEKQELWNHATFVFDTNVFLNLYRYTAKTRELLMAAFDSFSDRLWMPDHVACEFMKNRSNIIWESNNKYEVLSNEANKLVDSCRTQLNLDPADKDIAEMRSFLEQWIDAAKRKNIVVSKYAEDKILEKLLDLFDGKVGPKLSDEEKKAIEQEGKNRYAAKIPPGYKDSEKKKGDDLNNTYGDLIVWKQILNYAKSAKTDIVLVTNDQKEDWWEILHSQTIGPRVELKREFSKETSQRFHMYSMRNFITLFESGRDKEVDKETIDEIEFFTKVLRHKSDKKALWDYYGSLESNEEEAARLRFQIMRLENKNRKRRINVDYNREKYALGGMPKDTSEMVNNCLAHIERDNAQIEKLKEKLKQLQ